jgi:hypothetical protein
MKNKQPHKNGLARLEFSFNKTFRMAGCENVLHQASAFLYLFTSKTKVMKMLILFISLSLSGNLSAQYTYNHLDVKLSFTETELKYFTYENLRLYPVKSKESFRKEFQTVGKYMTLQEAITKNKIKITESDNSGTVNTLKVENVSKDTIIIIAGDVVKGGKQDRVVSQDIVLTPNNGKKNLSVYCVEAGRWTSENNSSNVAGRNNSYNDKNQAPAEFKGHYNKSSVSLRKVVEKEKDQTKVWSKVDELNAANKTENSTKTYTALAQSGDYSKKLEQYIQFFKNRFINDKDVVGVIVVTGNKVIGCDMFATHDLFTSQYESLLHSYSTEAIVSGRAVTVSAATVKSYADKLMSSESLQQVTLKEKGNSFTDKGKKLRVSSYD